MQNQDIELITRLVMEAIQEQAPSEQGFAVPVGVSARHVHLSQADLETLFGEGYQLTKKKELMGGQFASNEQVTLVGLKLRAIENVRILGPCRSAPIALVGPKGVLYLNEGCIVAQRHIHMSPADAAAAGVKDGDIVSVKAENERGTTFNHVKIRVDDSFTLEMHIDTDEANAAGIKHGDTVRMFK